MLHRYLKIIQQLRTHATQAIHKHGDIRQDKNFDKTGKWFRFVVAGYDKGNIDSEKKGQWRPKCQVDNCTVTPRYGTELSNSEKLIAVRCNAHKLKEDVGVVKGKICQYDGCDTRATFGDSSKMGLYSQHELLKYCKKHSDPNRDTNISTVICFSQDCTKQASFGCPVERQPKWCMEHAFEPENINVTVRVCENINCLNPATFGKPGDKVRPVRRCVEHKLNTDANPYRPTCEHLACTTTPSYGNKGSLENDEKGDTKPKRCARHKKENDSHWFLNKCIQDACDKNAYYGYVSSNLSSRRDASKQYDIETGKTNHALWCHEHKPVVDLLASEDDTIIMNIKNSGSCLGTDELGYPCTITPSFIDSIDGKDRWCSAHKPENVRLIVESKYCEEIECNTVASFGTIKTDENDPNNSVFTRKRCALHKTEDMVHFLTLDKK